MSKVVLADNRPTKTLTLPSFPEAQVEIYASLLVKDIKTLDPNEAQLAQGIKLAPKFIKSWNLTNEKGEDLPINEDSIDLLPEADISFILTSIADFAQEQKKS